MMFSQWKLYERSLSFGSVIWVMEQVGHFFAFFVVLLNVAHGIFLFHFFFLWWQPTHRNTRYSYRFVRGVRRRESFLFILLNGYDYYLFSRRYISPRSGICTGSVLLWLANWFALWEASRENTNLLGEVCTGWSTRVEPLLLLLLLLEALGPLPLCGSFELPRNASFACHRWLLYTVAHIHSRGKNWTTE